MEALKKDPLNRQAILSVAQVFFGRGSYPEAEGLLYRYLDLFPEDLEIQNQLIACEKVHYQTLLSQSEVSQENFRPRSFSISVLVSTYASEAFMRECLTDLESQSIAEQIEIIVIDAHSPEHEKSIVQEFQQRYDNIRYIRTSERIGVYAAWNLGIIQASAPNLMPFSTNDSLNLKACEILLRELESHPEIMLVYGDSYLTDTPHERFGKHTRSSNYHGVFQWPDYRFEDLLVNCRVGPHPLWRREVHTQIGYFDTRFLAIGDQDFWIRIGWKYSLRHLSQFTGLVWLTHESLSGKASAKQEIVDIQSRHIQHYKNGNLKNSLPKASESISRVGFRPRPFRVSALVSTYNSERFLRECLEDLEAQSIREELEIIVVDTGSEQNEFAIIEEYQNRYDNIIYIRTKKRETVYWAWNRGIQESTGRYLTNANTDDRHHPEAFKLMANALDQDTLSVLAYADCAITAEENSRFFEAQVSGYFRWPDFNAMRLFQVCFIGPQPMWRREIHWTYGYFDATFKSTGDYDFWLRLCLQERFHHIPEVLGLYYLGGESLEHQDSQLTENESNLARSRNWPMELGNLPPPTSGFFVPAEKNFTKASWVPAKIPLPENRSQPMVSVIVPTRNRPELLIECVKSILNQSYTNFEVWVINDAGVPVESFLQGLDVHNRIHYLRFSDHRERSAARNAALRMARGEFIAYLDDDDIFYPNHLETLVHFCVSTGAKVAYTDAHRMHVGNSSIQNEELVKDCPYSFDFDAQDIFISNCFPTLCILHHRDLFTKAGGFDESLSSHEDWELWIRYSRLEFFHHIPEITCAFRWDSERTETVERAREFQKTRQSIYKRTQHFIANNPRLQAFREKATLQFEREILVLELRCDGIDSFKTKQFFNQADHYLKNEQWKEAYEYYRILNQAFSQDLAVMKQLGKISRKVGDDKTAMALSLKVMELSV